MAIYVSGRMEIQALRVKCNNNEKGCEWKGTVGTLDEHMESCTFTLVPCPNRCKDDDDQLSMILKKDLRKHLNEQCLNRDYKCEFCGEEDNYANITQIHDKVCKNKTLVCPNAECDQVMKRFKIQRHIENDCRFAVIACKYESIGCDEKLKKKDMGTHEQDDKVHLHQALDTVVELKRSLRERSDIIIRLQQDLKTTMETIKSMKNDATNSKPNTIMSTTPAQKEFYILQEGDSFTFKLMKYSAKKANREIFMSRSFYTSVNGYNMCVLVYPNGRNGWYHGENTHVSVYIKALEGKNDKALRWPFTGTIVITLLNQSRDSNHHCKLLMVEKKADLRVGRFWGYSQFLLHSELCEPSNSNCDVHYLKDDTLYFRISLVEVIGHKPWLECTE